MKKFIFAVMCALVSTVAMAENNESANKNIEFNYNLNMASVTRYLKLNDVQAEQMQYVIERFDSELKRMKKADDTTRAKRFTNALSYNISAAHSVLDAEQYNKYLFVLNSALRSKGLDQLVNNNIAMND